MEDESTSTFSTEEEESQQQQQQQSDEIPENAAPNPSAITPNVALSGIHHPGKNDVMFGRGGDTNYHIGNHRFRTIADEYTHRYHAASRKEKAAVVRELVKRWRTEDPPGRFLTKTDPAKGDDSLWHDVGMDAAIKKAAKILSERCSEQRAAALGSNRKRPAKPGSIGQQQPSTLQHRRPPRPPLPLSQDQTFPPTQSLHMYTGDFLQHHFQPVFQHGHQAMHHYQQAIQPQLTAAALDTDITTSSSFATAHQSIGGGTTTNLTGSSSWAAPTPSSISSNSDQQYNAQIFFGQRWTETMTSDNNNTPSESDALEALAREAQNLPSAAALTEFFRNSDGAAAEEDDSA